MNISVSERPAFRGLVNENTSSQAGCCASGSSRSFNIELEIEELKAFDYSLELTGFDPDEIATFLVPTETVGLTDEDAAPDAPVDPLTQAGDLWILGKHRLLCGDSTSLLEVERLMGGGLADIVFQDPPYNVGYSGRGEINQLGTIQNDDLSDD